MSDSDEGGNSKDEELLLRYGLSAVLLTLSIIAYLLLIQTAPKTIVTPNVTTNDSTSNPNNTDPQARLASVNATITNINQTNSNVTVLTYPDDEPNKTNAQLLATRLSTDSSIKYPRGADDACIEEEQQTTKSVIENKTNDGVTYLVFEYMNNSTLIGIHMFGIESEESLNGQLLQDGHAIPDNQTTPSLRNASVDSAENERGIWSCIPERNESAFIPEEAQINES